MANTKLLAGFILGAAAGAALGVFLTSEKGKDLLADIKDTAGKFTEEIKETLNKGKQMVEGAGGSTAQEG